MASERVIILGASGFIGRSLTAALRGVGAEVIEHSSESLDCMKPESFRVLDSVMGPETTLICASALTPDKGQTVETFLVNTIMVANMAAYLGSRPLGRCVYVGSDAVYGFDVDPVTEETPVAPQSYYGLAKYAGEKVLEYANRGRPFLSLRLCGVYGPGDPHGAYGPNSFARSLAKDRTIRLFGSGEEERDHLYIDDVGRLAVALLRTNAAGAFNLATGVSRSFEELVHLIRGIVPYIVAVEVMPRTGPISHRHFDTARLRHVVPRFTFMPIQEGLQATLKAFGALPWPILLGSSA